MSTDDSLHAFGPFAAVFLRGEVVVPAHLPLLGLRGLEADVVLDRIAVALAHEPRPGIEALLRDPNWRPNLVAACAYLLDTARALEPDLLWSAIDRGSWVAPQLVVSALFVDPGFAEKARARVPGALGAKSLASVLAAARVVPSLASWHAIMTADADVAALQRQDDAWNTSGRIVTSWMDAAIRILAKRGIALRVPQ